MRFQSRWRHISNTKNSERGTIIGNKYNFNALQAFGILDDDTYLQTIYDRIQAIVTFFDFF